MKITNKCPICTSKNIKKKPAILMPFIAKRIFDWESIKIDKELGLRTIKTGNAYCVCNSCLCEKCNFIYLDMRFDDEEMKNLYYNYRGEEYNMQREFFEPGYTIRDSLLKKKIHYLDEIEKFILQNTSTTIHSLLDWGGEQGTNTPFQDNAKINKFVYDLSDKDSLFPQIKKIENIDDGQGYDLITCMHVLEHTPEPLKELIKIRKNLKKNGYIYIEVPRENLTIDYSDPLERLNNKHHWHEHINFYDFKSLEFLVKKADLELIAIKDKNVTKSEFKLNIFQLIARKIDDD